MFCKHCGDHIKNGYCIRCGKPVGPGPMEGGIGFWDLAGKGGETPPHVIDTGRLEDLILTGTERLDKGMGHIYRRQAQLHKQQTVLLTAIAVLLVVGLALDALLLYAVCDIRYAIPETTTEETALPTETEVATEDDAVEEPTVPIETEMPSVATYPEESQPLNIEIEKQPTSEHVNEQSDPETSIFIVKVRNDGQKLEFKWEKCADGNWTDISTLGLTEYLSVESEAYSTTLRLKMYSENILGEYRCRITEVDNEGNFEYTDSVFIENSIIYTEAGEPAGWNG